MLEEVQTKLYWVAVNLNKSSAKLPDSTDYGYFPSTKGFTITSVKKELFVEGKYQNNINMVSGNLIKISSKSNVPRTIVLGTLLL